MIFDHISINDLSLIIFSLIIICSYFFDLISKRTGIPSVLILITLGIIVSQSFSFFLLPKPSAEVIQNAVGILGGAGVILIVLEAAIDLRLKKESTGLILKAFLMALLGLTFTSLVGAFVLSKFTGIEISLALLYTIPLSILSSAIILPSIGLLEKEKKDFMVYESSFSDILGIISFHLIIGFHEPGGSEGMLSEVGINLLLVILLSIIISYVLIYFFQKIKEGAKLFFLLSILALLYGIGKVLHFESLILILFFGVVLNNHTLFFKGKLKTFIDEQRVESLIDNFKVLIGETAFVIRTFFFVLFGFSIVMAKLFELEVLYIGLSLVGVIFIVRAVFLLIFTGKNVSPLIYLAPRGLITVLLFMKVQSENIEMGANLANIDGVLLFVILFSCLIMMYGLIINKKQQNQKELLSSEIGSQEEELSNEI
tara:strand:- start:10 stop:1290 length:1281 start_codon:yes stop_codon:yes gene_type:complete